MPSSSVSKNPVKVKTLIFKTLKLLAWSQNITSRKTAALLSGHEIPHFVSVWHAFYHCIAVSLNIWMVPNLNLFFLSGECRL